MKRDLLTAAGAIVVLTVLLGLLYPLAITGVAQVAFPGKADGDRSLIATAVKSPRLFQPRPSATGYSATATYFSNRGPNSRSARAFFRQQARRYSRLNHVPLAQVPVDAVTTSASGVDPHISLANARIQARRVAAERKVPLSRVMALVDAHTDGRFLGVFGEPGVNVVDLNAELGG